MVARAGLSNQLRIIGGRWRGRRLRLCGAPELRPTPDRVRETVFNWLQAPLPGGRCLDLFAGSGALGLEALSRGAAEVVFVERNAAIARRLQDNLALLEAVSGRLERADALIWLRRKPEPFDIVFLDPPFGRNLLEPPPTRGRSTRGSATILRSRGQCKSAQAESGQKVDPKKQYRKARVYA